jgi:two-component system, OmpR family, phosphate regulon sensor histidine kinase PhoR
MRSWPLWIRLLVPFFVLSALIAGVSLGMIYWLAQGSVYPDQVRTLDTAVSVVRQFSTPDGKQLLPDAAAQLRAIGQVSQTRVTVIAGDGNVLFDTDVDPKTLDNHNDRPEVTEARRKHMGTASRQSKSLNQHGIYLAEIVNDADPNGLVARVCYTHTRWSSLQTPLWAVAAGGLGSTVMMVAVLAFILQRQWVRPTRDLTSAASKMAMGEWNARVDPYGAGDVRFLARKMNQLAAQAENQLAELGRQRRDLRSLVDTLPDPILVTDSAGRVLLINSPAAELLQLSPSQVIGKKTVSVINDEALLQLLDATSKVSPEPNHNGTHDVPHVHREVRLLRGGQRLTYQSVATQTATGGALLVLRDVSTMANTLQMKTDFVANASHELRTPLASIRAAVETIKDAGVEDQETTRRCIDIINNHALRLQMMVQDLLDLSRTEDARAVVRIDRIDLALACEMAVSLFAPAAAEKHVPIKIELAEDAQTFRGDERLLMLILKNLVDNAIKFTQAGSITIRSRKTADPEQFILEVQDTGCGIPLEDQERVFERFYTVNRSRGGADRGTGLGLSIVKHAVNATGGHVELLSEVNKGTTIRCLFPIKP